VVSDHTSSEAESWLQGVEDTENLVAELDLVLVVTLRQVLYLQIISKYFYKGLHTCRRKNQEYKTK
jgi:hypothetical protein